MQDNFVAPDRTRVSREYRLCLIVVKVHNLRAAISDETAPSGEDC